MAKTHEGDTIHLTVAQALVKYLSVQFSEFDDIERRLIPGIFGIFGHGNVAGLGQALEEHGAACPITSLVMSNRWSTRPSDMPRPIDVKQRWRARHPSAQDRSTWLPGPRQRP